MDLAKLPVKTLMQIATCLSPRDVFRLRHVCRRLRTLVPLQLPVHTLELAGAPKSEEVCVASQKLAHLLQTESLTAVVEGELRLTCIRLETEEALQHLAVHFRHTRLRVQESTVSWGRLRSLLHPALTRIDLLSSVLVPQPPLEDVLVALAACTRIRWHSVTPLRPRNNNQRWEQALLGWQQTARLSLLSISVDGFPPDFSPNLLAKFLQRQEPEFLLKLHYRSQATGRTPVERLAEVFERGKGRGRRIVLQPTSGAAVSFVLRSPASATGPPKTGKRSRLR